MAELCAGFGRADITPKLGCQLVGYAGRPGGAAGVHDRLTSRAMVLDDENGCWAIVSNELCYLSSQMVNQIRRAIQRRTGFEPSRVLITTTHTHAGPHDANADDWDRPLSELIADAVEMAYEARRPARFGSGSGFLYGHSINRRWLDRPIDPGIAVLRVDDEHGHPMGLLANFGCHAVVLGSDNLQISGDWPGHAMRVLEESLGPDTTCLFTQGGAGDVNPLTAGVRRRLRGGHTVTSIGEISAYYGPQDDPERWSIEDRSGGTFEEVAELGDAFAEEAAYIARHIQTVASSSALWSEQVTVNAAAEPGEHSDKPNFPLLTERPDFADADNIPAEFMLLGIGDMILVTQPGEVFAETGFRLKTYLRSLGYGTPALVTYANGFLVYLPEPDAFDEGGYEPQWAVSLGISGQFQNRFRRAIEPIIQRQAPGTQSRQ